MTKKLNIDIIARDKSKQALNQVQGNLAKTKTSILTLKNALIGIGAGAILKSFVDVGREIESLQVRFKFLFGSAEEGQIAFDNLSKFASRVPFSLENIAAASGNLGVVAKDAKDLTRILEITGNVAAFTGLDFETTASQIQRAFSGGIAAADIFREKGLRQILGFEAGAKVSIDETIEAFEKTFGKGGKLGKVTDDLAETLNGTVSMLQDTFFNFQKLVAEQFIGTLTDELGDLDDFLKKNDETIEELAKTLGKGLAEGAILAGEAIDTVTVAIGALVATKGKVDEFLEIFDTDVFRLLTGTNGIKGLSDELDDFNPTVNNSTEKLRLFRDAEMESRKAIEETTDEIKKQKEEFQSKVNIDQILADNEVRIQEEKHQKILADQESFSKEMKRRQSAEKIFAKMEAEKKAEIERMAQGQIVDAVGDGLSKVSGLNKDAFRAYQAFQIGMATLNTFRAASNALSTYPFPLNIGVAAAETARGLATVAQIRATAPPRISGGRVNAGEPYMVGEGGRPELFVPQSSGTIVPNNQLGSPNVNITINANDTEGFDELLVKRRSVIVNVINDALNSQGKEALV
jgi:hypothetical protein